MTLRPPQLGENLDPAPEPVDSCYAANLSNQALHLGKVSQETFRLLLTLDALFFDRIVLGAPELLANDMLLDLARSDRNGAQQFYGAVLAPVSDKGSCQEIAELMIERKTIHHLRNKSDLRAHATLIDESKPKFLHASEAGMRAGFHGLLTNLTSKPGSALGELTPSDLKKFATWLSRQNPSSTYCTELYRWANRTIQKPSARQQLKIAADVAQQIAKCDSQFAVFASPDGDWVDSVHAIHRKAHPETWCHRNLRRVRAEEEPSLRLDIRLLGRLPLGDVAKLRNFSAFHGLRQDIAEHRAGRRRLDPTRLQGRLDEAGNIIADFAASNKLGRENYTKNARFRFWYDAAANLAPVGIQLVVPGKLGLVFGFVTWLGLNIRARRPAVTRISNTCISGPRFAPLNGTLLPG